MPFCFSHTVKKGQKSFPSFVLLTQIYHTKFIKLLWQITITNSDQRQYKHWALTNTSTSSHSILFFSYLVYIENNLVCEQKNWVPNACSRFVHPGTNYAINIGWLCSWKKSPRLCSWKKSPRRCYISKEAYSSSHLWLILHQVFQSDYSNIHTSYNHVNTK